MQVSFIISNMMYYFYYEVIIMSKSMDSNPLEITLNPLQESIQFQITETYCYNTSIIVRYTTIEEFDASCLYYNALTEACTL